jgi:hypothetical protein
MIQDASEAIRNGTDTLLAAINSAKQGKPHRVRTAMIWSMSQPPSVPHEYPRAASELAKKQAMIEQAVSRDPCFRCGARGDLECGH